MGRAGDRAGPPRFWVRWELRYTQRKRNIMIEGHEANRRQWDQLATYWKELRDRDQLWRRCPSSPELAFGGEAYQMVQAFCGDLVHREVCVVGSGDNYAAFALAGLGARVTSVDISENQLAVARLRSQELGLDIQFVRADAADLEPLQTGRFDMVCSTNGFLVWIADLVAVFRSVIRVLRAGGVYIFYDVHPFQRPWGDDVSSATMERSYWDIGPHRDAKCDSFEFTWTVSHILNALADAGLVIRRMAESPASSPRFWQDHSYESASDETLNDWHRNPRAGLPVWLTVCSQKP